MQAGKEGSQSCLDAPRAGSVLSLTVFFHSAALRLFSENTAPLRRAPILHHAEEYFMIRSIVMALAICLACSAPALAAGKIGIINLVGITANSDVGKAADKLLQDRFGKERSALEKQGETLKKDMDQFRTQAAAMSEDSTQQEGARTSDPHSGI